MHGPRRRHGPGGCYSRGPAQLLVNPEQSASERLQNYGAQDLVLCLSVYRYLRSTLEIARWLRTRDVPVVAFTDNALAPIALHGDLPLVLPRQGVALFDSYTAFTALGLYPGKPRS